MNRNRLILLSVVAGTMAVFVPLAMGSSSPGCEPVVNAPIESDQFTPYEVRRSKLPEPILNPEGEPLPAGLDAPTSIEGLALRWQDGSNPDGSPVALYFSDGPLVGTPLSTFFKSGGVQLTGSQSTVGSSSLRPSKRRSGSAQHRCKLDPTPE
jgi:hypothetical protein